MGDIEAYQAVVERHVGYVVLLCLCGRGSAGPTMDLGELVCEYVQQPAGRREWCGGSEGIAGVLM